MKFVKTMKLLTEQADQQDIAMEAALEFVRTYLTELRHQTGTSIEKRPIRDIGRTIASLTAVSNDIVFVFRKNEEAILGSKDKYVQSLQKAQDTCGTYTQQLSELEQQIRQEEELRVRLESLLKQVSGRNAELAQLRRKSEDLQSQVAALSAENPDTEAARLQALIAQQTQLVAKSTEELTQARETLASLQIREEECKTQITQTAGEVQECQNKIESLESQLNSEQVKHKEMSGHLQSLEQRLRQLYNDMDAAQREQTDVFHKIDTEEQNLKIQLALNEEMEALLAVKSAEVETTKARYSQVNAERDKLDASINTMEEHMEVIRHQLEDWQAYLEKLTAEDGQLHEQIEQLRATAGELEKRYGEAQQFHQQKQTELEQINEKITGQTLTNQAIDQDVTEKATTLSQLEARYSEAVPLQQSLEKQISELDLALDRLEEDTARKRTDIAAIQEALHAEKEENDRLLAKYVELNSALESQKVDNHNFRGNFLDPLQAELDAQTRQAEADKQQLDDLKENIRLKEKERASLSVENTNYMLLHHGKQKELEKVRKENTEIRQAVEKLEDYLKVQAAQSQPLLAREKELREILDKKDLARLTEEVENSIERHRQNIELANSKEAELEDWKRKLEQQQVQLTLQAEELTRCRTEQEQLQANYQQTIQELNQITCEENRQRCEKLYNHLQVMNFMAQRLTEHNTVPCGDSFRLSDAVTANMDTAESSLDTLRQVIREYASLRQNALE